MSIQFARNGNVKLAYEVEGPPDGIPLLLVSAGAGTQMAMWPAELRAGLVERGFQVAMMDQRDDGLSTYVTVKPRRGELAYTLRDLTDDTVAVLDALGWRSAVLAGASLGGMLAQAVACAQPDRASGLVSLLSTPTPSLRINRPKIWTVLRMIKVMSGKSADRDAEGQRWVDLFRLMATKDYPADDDHWRAAGRLAFDRGRHPVGAMRHSAALRAVGDRRAELATLRIPALVVHGSLDQLISTRAGRATADAIPGARFLLVPGMGHQLARPVWPMVLDEIGGLFAGQAQLSR